MSRITICECAGYERTEGEYTETGEVVHYIGREVVAAELEGKDGCGTPKSCFPNNVTHSAT